MEGFLITSYFVLSDSILKRIIAEQCMNWFCDNILERNKYVLWCVQFIKVITMTIEFCWLTQKFEYALFASSSNLED